ncbi:MAG: ATP-binding protein [Armatimonadetes bacterium]|nr:ATP-binding protein [Armatimonadota bacterium]
MTRSLVETHNPFSENALKEIFKVKAGKPSVIVSRENNRLEFRETFSLNACKDKLRTFAAFANNQGGYLVFGVKDRPRELKGITGTAFDDLKTDKLTGMLNEYFAPEIHWAAHEYEFEGMTFGLPHRRPKTLSMRFGPVCFVSR